MAATVSFRTHRGNHDNEEDGEILPQYGYDERDRSETAVRRRSTEASEDRQGRKRPRSPTNHVEDYYNRRQRQSSHHDNNHNHNHDGRRQDQEPYARQGQTGRGERSFNDRFMPERQDARRTNESQSPKIQESWNRPKSDYYGNGTTNNSSARSRDGERIRQHDRSYYERSPEMDRRSRNERSESSRTQQRSDSTNRRDDDARRFSSSRSRHSQERPVDHSSRYQYRSNDEGMSRQRAQQSVSGRYENRGGRPSNGIHGGSRRPSNGMHESFHGGRPSTEINEFSKGRRQPLNETSSGGRSSSGTYDTKRERRGYDATSESGWGRESNATMLGKSSSHSARSSSSKAEPMRASGHRERSDHSWSRQSTFSDNNTRAEVRVKETDRYYQPSPSIDSPNRQQLWQRESSDHSRSRSIDRRNGARQNGTLLVEDSSRRNSCGSDSRNTLKDLVYVKEQVVPLDDYHHNRHSQHRQHVTENTGIDDKLRQDTNVDVVMRQKSLGSASDSSAQSRPANRFTLETPAVTPQVLKQVVQVPAAASPTQDFPRAAVAAPSAASLIPQPPPPEKNVIPTSSTAPVLVKVEQSSPPKEIRNAFPPPITNVAALKPPAAATFDKPTMGTAGVNQSQTNGTPQQPSSFKPVATASHVKSPATLSIPSRWLKPKTITVKAPTAVKVAATAAKSQTEVLTSVPRRTSQQQQPDNVGNNSLKTSDLRKSDPSKNTPKDSDITKSSPKNANLSKSDPKNIDLDKNGLKKKDVSKNDVNKNGLGKKDVSKNDVNKNVLKNSVKEVVGGSKGDSKPTPVRQLQVAKPKAPMRLILTPSNRKPKVIREEPGATPELFDAPFSSPDRPSEENNDFNPATIVSEDDGLMMKASQQYRHQAQASARVDCVTERPVSNTQAESQAPDRGFYDEDDSTDDSSSSDDSETDEEELMEWAHKMFGVQPGTVQTKKQRLQDNGGRCPSLKLKLRLPNAAEQKAYRNGMSMLRKESYRSEGTAQYVTSDDVAKVAAEENRRRKELSKPLTAAEVEAILADDDADYAPSTWVRRSTRQPSRAVLTSPKVRMLLEKLKSNDSDMVVLKMKKYLSDPDAPPAALDVILDALEENSNCEALYIQNFNQGMRNEQVMHLLKILQLPTCRIWCLNIGETYNVSTKTWMKFAAGLKDTKVTHMYTSEHTISTELKDEIRETIRLNRSKHDMHCNPNNLDTIILCTHCWWNPINTKALRPYLRNRGFEHMLHDTEQQGLRGSTSGAPA